MAGGKHWEWRGFGRISQDFRTRFETLPLNYPKDPWADFIDEYLWVPGSQINLKLRTGFQAGLKFKRLEQTEGDYELWVENPDELYPYENLNASVLNKVAQALGIRLPSIPEGPFDRYKTLLLLSQASPAVKPLTVVKRRQTRVWRAESKVLVEIAEISSPQVTTSVSLESDVVVANGISATQLNTARQTIVTVMDLLQIKQESLRSLNYLGALKIWATGEKL
jgi:hypothetical protein